MNTRQSHLRTSLKERPASRGFKSVLPSTQSYSNWNHSIKSSKTEVIKILFLNFALTLTTSIGREISKEIFITTTGGSERLKFEVFIWTVYQELTLRHDGTLNTWSSFCDRRACRLSAAPSDRHASHSSDTSLRPRPKKKKGDLDLDVFMDSSAPWHRSPKNALWFRSEIIKNEKKWAVWSQLCGQETHITRNKRRKRS